MENERIKILEKVASGELTPEKASTELLALNNIVGQNELKELLKSAFDAGCDRQWSIDYQENVNHRPSFEEWYKSKAENLQKPSNNVYSQKAKERFDLNIEEIKEKYYEWMNEKGVGFIENKGDESVEIFLRTTDILHSSIVSNDMIDSIKDILRPIRIKFYMSKQNSQL